MAHKVPPQEPAVYTHGMLATVRHMPAGLTWGGAYGHTQNLRVFPAFMVLHVLA